MLLRAKRGQDLGDTKAQALCVGQGSSECLCQGFVIF